MTGTFKNTTVRQLNNCLFINTTQYQSLKKYSKHFIFSFISVIASILSLGKEPKGFVDQQLIYQANISRISGIILSNKTKIYTHICQLSLALEQLLIFHIFIYSLLGKLKERNCADFKKRIESNKNLKSIIKYLHSDYLISFLEIYIFKYLSIFL